MNTKGFTLISRLVKAKPTGFTLIELLVVTAILGILIGVSSSVFIGILRSQNKTNATNEVRQNANLVIDLLERDVRGARSIQPTGSQNLVTLSGTPSGDIEWECREEVIMPLTNGYIRRRVLPSVTWQDITNKDTQTGVSIDCSPPTFSFAFNVSSGTTSQIITVRFNARQALLSPQRTDFQIELPFETTVGTRQF